jgi:hypothetical protein
MIGLLFALVVVVGLGVLVTAYAGVAGTLLFVLALTVGAGGAAASG